MKVMVRKTWGTWARFPPTVRYDLTTLVLMIMNTLFLTLSVIYDSEGVGGWFTAAAVPLFLSVLLRVNHEE